MNTIKTGLLLAALTALLLVFGRVLGGHGGLLVACVIVLVMNFSAYWFSDRMVLAMYKAQPVTENEAPELYAIVTKLANMANLPMPSVYTVNDDSPNAFATGRNPEHSSIAVTTGLLKLLNREELTGVLAHELCHVQHRDTLISVIAATLAGAIGLLANMAQWALIFGGRSDEGEDSVGVGSTLVMAILAPIMASLIQLAVSRSREYGADEGGARLTGQPLWLARALRKIEQGAQATPSKAAHERPATAHLFIINPLTASKLANLFATHPPVEKRVERLEAMARGRYS